MKKSRILIVGNKLWISNNSIYFNKLNQTYQVQFIFDVNSAFQRLWHNSYDILFIQQKFCKQNTIQLSKMSYARSKPSIIFCQNIFKKLYYQYNLNFSKFTSICKTMKKLTYLTDKFDQKFFNSIDLICNNNYYIKYFNEISLQIDTIYNK